MKKIIAALLLFCFLIPFFPTAQAAEEKVAAFTFDDGPHKTITPALLDALAERGVRVTFFVNGRNAERYPEIVQRAAAEGHQIANHTYSHQALTTLSDKRVLEEVSRTQDYLSELLGEQDYLVRVPYGSISDRVQELIDVPIIMWSVDPTNGKVTSADAMRDGIVRTTHDGAIILMHDTSNANLTASIEAIDQLLAEGYTFLTVDELFAIKGVTPAGSTQYRKVTGKNVGDFFDESTLSSHWAYDAIRTVQKARLMQGDDRGFRPNWGMTRAEALTVLWRLAGEPKSTRVTKPFGDVKGNDWYSDAVNWAVAEEITLGVSDTRFGAAQYITKEQFYTFFVRYLEAAGMEPEVKAEVPILPGDELVSSWAYPAVHALRSYGFASAEAGGRFAPKSLMTRAETAEILAWYLAVQQAA